MIWPQIGRVHWRYGKSMLKSLPYLLYLLKVNEGEFKTKDSFSPLSDAHYKNVCIYMYA